MHILDAIEKKSVFDFSKLTIKEQITLLCEIATFLCVTRYQHQEIVIKLQKCALVTGQTYSNTSDLATSFLNNALELCK
jgi:hypothetical protein